VTPPFVAEGFLVVTIVVGDMMVSVEFPPPPPPVMDELSKEEEQEEIPSDDDDPVPSSKEDATFSFLNDSSCFLQVM